MRYQTYICNNTIIQSEEKKKLEWVIGLEFNYMHQGSDFQLSLEHTKTKILKSWGKISHTFCFIVPCAVLETSSKVPILQLLVYS